MTCDLQVMSGKEPDHLTSKAKSGHKARKAEAAPPKRKRAAGEVSCSRTLAEHGPCMPWWGSVVDTTDCNMHSSSHRSIPTAGRTTVVCNCMRQFCSVLKADSCDADS